MAKPVPAPMTRLSGDLSAGVPGAGGLGLLGGTVLVLALHLLGLAGAGSVMTRQAVLFGGLSLIVAGLRAWRQGNGFGTSVFLGYGLFFLSLLAFVILPAAGIGQDPSRETLLAYLLLWGSFSFLLFLASLTLPVYYRVFFGLLFLLLLLLVANQLFDSTRLPLAAGLSGLAVTAAAGWTIITRIRLFLA